MPDLHANAHCDDYSDQHSNAIEYADAYIYADNHANIYDHSHRNADSDSDFHSSLLLTSR